ncbi:MAG TPA: alpha-ketoglutarate-dependent dioxygenase AlkB [Friedmanniella sp.]
MTVQASLFDPSLLGTGLLDPTSSEPSLFDEVGAEAPVGDGPDPDLGSLTGTVRHQLARGAWVDLLPGWLSGGGLLERLLADVPWCAERRPMYDRVVDVPRLLCHYAEGEPLPHPTLEAIRDALNARYAPELGEPLVSTGLCLYRDGADSVAWHGDTIGRGRTSDTVVAILSLGSPREFLLRPRGGSAVARAIAGADLSGLRATSAQPVVPSRPVPSRAVTGTGTIRHTLHHGDLVVMGGSCQRTWEHAVPKTTRSVGPRVSIQLRPRGVS